MHAAQGRSSMPRLRSMAQMTTSRHAARLPSSSFSPPLLPAPVAPPTMACRRRNSTRHGSASSNGPRSIGSVIEVTDGPCHEIESACGSRSKTRSSQRLARSSGVGWTRIALRWVPNPDSMAGIFAITSVMVWPRARRSRARHPHRSTVADMICEPASPMSLAMSGQVATARSTRTFARRRRFAHHGTDSTSAPMPSACGSGEVSGPSAAASASQVPHASTIRAT